MSAPSFAQLPPPPLPLGWSEHIAPGGQTYYYNAEAQVSTYVRPIPTFPVMPTVQPESTKKKEKPLLKTRIPGTDWLRVKTTEGNIFYSHKIKKESVWTVPDEIRDAVEQFEREEAEKLKHHKQDPVTAAAAEAQKVERELSLEVERVKGEVQAMVKRKAEEVVPIDEVVVTKKVRVEQYEQEEDSESDEEEEWQREAAAQLAAEAEAERKRVAEMERTQRAAEEEVERLKAAQINMPERVDLSLEEAKALFKGLLREKDINPLHPWDTSLPQFVSDPRYVLLPTVSARRETFDEYCRDRARELRASTVKKERAVADPRAEFENLLNAEVKSTRSSWTDFRRAWKKDRRYYGWGRDDREREKRFREFIKDLGEKKRLAAEKAELDFFALLRERGGIKVGSVWKDIKRNLSDDPRYDAVGSSSLREELFNTFLSGNHLSSGSASGLDNSTKQTSEDAEMELDEGESQRKRWERKERAVREREQRVRAERDRLEVDIERSRMGMNQDEGEREFKSLLTDAVRDPQMTWTAALPQLKTDPRFRNSPLPPNLQLRLFHIHVAHLRSRHMDGLRALFETYAPSLATGFSALPLPSLLASLPVTRLGSDIKALESEFEKWQRERTHEARKAFDEMLAENSFVEFWGRLGKIGGEGVDGGVKADETGDDEGEGGGGRVDMKALAKNVDVGDIEKVLKNDKRYIMFEHIPEQREHWIRNYLSNLTAPKLSVHLPQTPIT